MLNNVYIAKIENIVGKIRYFFEEVSFLWKNRRFRLDI